MTKCAIERGINSQFGVIGLNISENSRVKVFGLLQTMGCQE
ncbi:MAG: hypothetical protein AAGE96_23060 [Cyanobacteria bacterium P01_G01_bin.19]